VIKKGENDTDKDNFLIPVLLFINEKKKNHYVCMMACTCMHRAELAFLHLGFRGKIENKNKK